MRMLDRAVILSRKNIGKPCQRHPYRLLRFYCATQVVQMKQRNRTWGCPRIAQQIALAFGIEINKDMVRRIRSGPTPRV
jgi:transposase